MEEIKDLEIDIQDDEIALQNDLDELVMCISHLNTSINNLRRDRNKLAELLNCTQEHDCKLSEDDGCEVCEKIYKKNI